MRIIARSTLRDFWQRHPDAEQPLLTWFRETRLRDWQGPKDIKKVFASASFLKDNRVVFNIGGNKYRLVVRVNYVVRQVYVRFVGTHADYDKIDAERI